MPRVTGNPPFKFIHEDRIYPEPQNGVRYLGLEWENDTDSRSGRNLPNGFPDRMDALFSEPYPFWHKRDGSVHNGYETVTHPMTFGAMKAFLQRLIDANITSGNDADRAGIHVHVNKNGFRRGNQARANMILLIHGNRNLFQRISKRTENRYNCWSPSNISEQYTYNGVSERPNNFGGAYNSSRHTYTDEIRIFNSESEPAQVLEIIKLVNFMCDFADDFEFPEFLKDKPGQFKYVKKAFASHAFKNKDKISDYYLKCIQENLW